MQTTQTHHQGPRPRVIAALVALVALGAGCDTAEQAGIPSKANYDFGTSCESESNLEACSACCTGLSFDTALEALGDCGCAYAYRDDQICQAHDGDFDACDACCRASDDASATQMANGECRCLGIQKTKPAADRQPNHCVKSGDSCKCSRDTTGTCGPSGLDDDPALYCTCSL